tara:strand:- start:29 stop:1405 length:1377 start_codon:yes stop_codon:yes gene_type:complete
MSSVEFISTLAHSYATGQVSEEQRQAEMLHARASCLESGKSYTIRDILEDEGTPVGFAKFRGYEFEDQADEMPGDCFYTNPIKFAELCRRYPEKKFGLWAVSLEVNKAEVAAGRNPLFSHTFITEGDIFEGADTTAMDFSQGKIVRCEFKNYIAQFLFGRYKKFRFIGMKKSECIHNQDEKNGETMKIHSAEIRAEMRKAYHSCDSLNTPAENRFREKFYEKVIEGDHPWDILETKSAMGRFGRTKKKMKATARLFNRMAEGWLSEVRFRRQEEKQEQQVAHGENPYNKEKVKKFSRGGAKISTRLIPAAPHANHIARRHQRVMLDEGGNDIGDNTPDQVAASLGIATCRNSTSASGRHTTTTPIAIFGLPDGAERLEREYVLGPKDNLGCLDGGGSYKINLVAHGLKDDADRQDKMKELLKEAIALKYEDYDIENCLFNTRDPYHTRIVFILLKKRK